MKSTIEKLRQFTKSPAVPIGVKRHLNDIAADLDEKWSAHEAMMASLMALTPEEREAGATRLVDAVRSHDDNPAPCSACRGTGSETIDGQREHLSGPITPYTIPCRKCGEGRR